MKECTYTVGNYIPLCHDIHSNCGTHLSCIINSLYISTISSISELLQITVINVRIFRRGLPCVCSTVLHEVGLEWSPDEAPLWARGPLQVRDLSEDLHEQDPVQVTYSPACPGNLHVNTCMDEHTVYCKIHDIRYISRISVTSTYVLCSNVCVLTNFAD